MRKSYAVVALFGLFAVILAFQSVLVDAHSPSGVNLEYSLSTNELSVDVTHDVTNVNTHYIEQIIIEKNSVQVASRDYTSQDTTSGMSDTFVEADEGDVLRATATCSISGQLSAEITVTNTTTTTSTTETTMTSPTEDGQPLSPTLLILAAVAVVAVLAVVLVVMRGR